MRCQFCGWDNPQGKERCEKCNKTLSPHKIENISTADNLNHDSPKTEAFNIKATVRERGIDSVDSVDEKICPECGYPLENNQCASCGYSGKKDYNTDSTSLVAKKTIRPIRKSEGGECFSMTPISESNGEPEGKPIVYRGGSIILNRDNTDPQNATITSLNQANIIFENGKWNIEDKSEFKTTFVQSIYPIELHDGDLVLLGNQLFRFNSN